MSERSKGSQLGSILNRLPVVGTIKRDAERVQALTLSRRQARIAVVADEWLSARELINALHRGPALSEPTSGWIDVADGTKGLSWLVVTPDSELPAELGAVDAVLLVDHQDVREAVSAKQAHTLERLLAQVSVKQSRVLPLMRQLGTENTALVAEIARHGRQTASPLRLKEDSDHGQLASWLVRNLPDETRVETARVLKAPGATLQLADDLIEACATLAVTFALTPVPFSDMMLIGPLHGAMVASLARLSGREWNAETAAEWISSVGLIGGAGMGFRELARQAVKLVPGAGLMISGGIAGAGTLAVGESAKLYLFNVEQVAQKYPKKK